MSESREQKSVVKVLRRSGILFSSIPNEITRNDPHWRGMGLLRGMPDILIFDPPPTSPQGIIGVALEMKSRSGRASKEQRRVLTELAKRGWFAFVGYGATHALEVLDKLGYRLKR
jgi:hypothetical protein